MDAETIAETIAARLRQEILEPLGIPEENLRVTRTIGEDGDAYYRFDYRSDNTLIGNNAAYTALREYSIATTRQFMPSGRELVFAQDYEDYMGGMFFRIHADTLETLGESRASAIADDGISRYAQPEVERFAVITRIQDLMQTQLDALGISDFVAEFCRSGAGHAGGAYIDFSAIIPDQAIGEIAHHLHDMGATKPTHVAGLRRLYMSDASLQQLADMEFNPMAAFVGVLEQYQNAAFADAAATMDDLCNPLSLTQGC